MNRWNEATPKDSGDEDDSLPDSLPPRTARRLGNLYSYHPHRDGNENDETEPLTPRDTTSLSSTEVLEMRNTSSYLSYFRSPPETQRANNTPASSSLKKRDPPQTLRPQITTPISRSGTLTHRRLQTPYTPSTQDVYYDNSDDEQSLKPQSSLPPRTEPSYVPAHYSASKGTTPGYLPRNRISLGAESRRSLHSSNSYDGLESVSVGSHLYGESLLSAESIVSTSPRIGSHIEIQNHSRTVKTQPIPVYDTVRSTPKRKQLKLVRSYQNFMHNVQSWTEGLRQQWAAQSHRTALPMSPRSKDLADIHFLQSQHAQKIKHLVPEDSRGFDFCLILQPQEVYAFWADLLDFRVELLGEDLTQAIEEHWEKTLRAKTGYALDDEVQDHKKDLESGTRLLQFQDEAQSPSDSYSIDHSEAKDTVTELKVPNFGLSRFLSSRRAETPAHSEAPSLYTVADRRTFFSTTSNKSRPLSMFERALGPVPVEELYVEDAVPSDGNFQATPRNATVTAGSNTSLVRRKWGSQVVRSATKPAIIASSPTRPLTPAAIPNRMTSNSQKFECQEKSETPNNPHEIRMEDIPNPKIPRGIAARTRGLSEFLPALRRGIVLRKHRPGQEATFCRIISVDGGDTIQVHALSPSQAYPLLREQRRLYNVPGRSSSASASDWSLEPHNEYGDLSSGSLNTSVRQFTRVVRKGVFRLADVVAVQPARREDPRSSADDKGTLTLRRSFSNYSENLAFSLVLRSTFGRSTVGNPTSIEEYEIRWGTGEGSESQFRYFDFEAATEGEYWLVFRGFLLLQRDAAVGRFAEQRAAGIGSHYSRVMGELREKVAQEHEVHQDEFQEPITVGFLERRLVEWRGLDMGYMKGFTAPGAVPPPSDYFLGFKAPGTAIWSRLRNSGLVVQRVYSLDRRQVILKIHCPAYRIMDVAEVLRVKLKTWDGSFASFRQDLIDLYRPLNDPLEESDADALPFEYVFASSVRQQIIDFIVRSRIRDSGAELGQATVKRPSGFDGLGKMIQARVALHMPGKLDAIYRSWVLYWKEENWTEYRDGKSLSHSGAVEDKSDDGVTDEEAAMGLSKTDTSDSGSLDAVAADESPLDKRMSSTRSQLSLFVPPPLWKRLFLGAFFQPLDSVESYFGEKVAFYFAWLQHTATHLVFLSVAGLLLFICQIASNDFDHPLRPVFAFIVMLWTYVVLVNWRKRANFLAYRWGTLNFKEQETTRPQFRGEFVEDEITGEDVVQYSKWKRWIKYAVSFPVMLIFTFCTLFMILWVHANRDMQLQEYFNETKADFEIDFSISAIGKGITSNSELTREVILDPTFWYLSMILPATVGLCLPLLNFVLSKLASMLNDFENYRTESEYRTHLIIKVFSFRFVCYFATLYYYAFVSTGDENRINNGMFRIATGVLVYVTVAHWWQVFLQIKAPIWIRAIRLHYRNRQLCQELRDVELEEEDLLQLETTTMTEEVKKRHIRAFNKRLLLEQAQDDIWMELMFPEHDSFADYIQAVVQFTFITCFSVVLPITPLICLLNYLLSMRLDAYKLCKGRRRPLAEKTGGIGVWEHLLHIVAVISVLTNCWLIVYTNKEVIWLGKKIIGPVGLFVTSEHVMLLIGYTMLTSISQMPKSVRDAMKREKHQLDEQRNASMRARQNHRSKYHRDDADENVAPVVQLSRLSTESPLPDDRTDESGSTRTLWSA